jgi:hypothetical protein
MRVLEQQICTTLGKRACQMTSSPVRPLLSARRPVLNVTRAGLTVPSSVALDLLLFTVKRRAPET